MLLKDLTTLTASLASGTLFHVEKSGKAYNIDYTKLAKAIVEEYNGSTLGGSAQSVQAAIGALNSRIANVYFKQLTSGNQQSVSFSMSGRATILAIGNDNGGRSWTAVINVTNFGTGSMVMIKENPNPEYNPTATFSSGKTVTLAVHEWENIVLISTGSFV